MVGESTQLVDVRVGSAGERAVEKFELRAY